MAELTGREITLELFERRATYLNPDGTFEANIELRVRLQDRPSNKKKSKSAGTHSLLEDGTFNYEDFKPEPVAETFFSGTVTYWKTKRFFFY